MKLFTSLLFFTILFFDVSAQSAKIRSISVKEYEVAEGWSKNSVNAVIFRKNSIVTHGKHQYVAFYDPESYLVLGKRKLGSSKWDIKRTQYKGNTNDAHNSISIMVDGNGFLHVAWDHHNNELRYARSVESGSLELGEKLNMTGTLESRVTYPEFYKMPDGDLLFFYRNGESGRGNLVINRYDLATGQWKQLQSNLIDGEGERSAYWQSCVDNEGTIHVSWVWRETWDVATNHDICYARSKDGGETWENSEGEKYNLPITLKTAEVALSIPQNSELINQTSMTTDDSGNPVIASYWKEKGSDIPQFHVVYRDSDSWNVQSATSRETPFSLSGGGTKKIPISRPQILVKNGVAMLIFRDEERGNKPSVAINRDFPLGEWETLDLSEENLGSWEPSYDTELWKSKGIVSLFVQEVYQADSEGLVEVEPTMVKVLEWKPKK